MKDRKHHTIEVMKTSIRITTTVSALDKIGMINAYAALRVLGWNSCVLGRCRGDSTFAMTGGIFGGTEDGRRKINKHAVIRVQRRLVRDQDCFLIGGRGS
jgi:hypothetical protein